jgi:hypothetical protein
MPKLSHASLLLFRARRALFSFTANSDQAIPPVAVLIDGENISAEFAVHILAAAGNFGGVTIRRVYGNWNHPSLVSWQAAAHHYGFQTIHHAHPVAGKNAADIALTIDALDLLYQGLRHFCLASSDTDFIPLVRRLRESGGVVLGIGKPGTREELKNAYNAFLTTDQLLPASARSVAVISLNTEKETSPPLSSQKESEQVTVPPSASETQRIEDDLLLQLLIQAYQRAATKGKSDWVSIQQLGATLHQLQPGFASKTYGFPKLKGLIQNYPQVFQTRSLKGGQIELQAKIRQ